MCSLAGNKKTDEHTVFEITSNSKAFTSAALGILVDDGKLNWNDKVTKFIPELNMYDPCVTKEFTIIDLLNPPQWLMSGSRRSTP